MTTWKEKLSNQIPNKLEREIEIFETQMELRKLGKLDEKIFAETRLRRGVYGQRYDNGQRHDGIQSRKLNYPSNNIIKGPDTLWDAPGMQRIKIPFGGLKPYQMDVLADLAEEYSDGIIHITTRQDIQFHYIHIDDTPDLMRRLAAVGITTLEACGNVVRNTTACPIAGVCHDEAFDVTPYANALSSFLLGHPDCQDFGRKFKVAFSGCKHKACGLVAMHDLGAIAITKKINGQEKRGFELYVGGGLGAVPHQAKLFDEFLPEEELLPIAQAMGRVFARLGEKKNRSRARIKFLVANLGIDKFREIVLAERKILPQDPEWHSYIRELPAYGESPAKEPKHLQGFQLPDDFSEWFKTNIFLQKQNGYAFATIALPLGDLTSFQMRKLADIARKYVGDNIRTTVEQNIVLRWVSEADLPALYQELKSIGLHEPGAGTIVDITTCPGTDTCKLGIASSRALTDVLRKRLSEKNYITEQAVKNLRIKVSGCFNSCGQHHIADIGFFGNSRNINGYKVPHFQVILGGQWVNNAGSFGLAIGSVPSKHIPEALDRITEFYIQNRQGNEIFQNFINRIGKRELRNQIEDLMQIPEYHEDKSFYTDWGDPREFTLGDLGAGECAGEVVTQTDFNMSNAERLVFEAQCLMDDNNLKDAEQTAYNSMLEAARALVKTQWYDVPEKSDIIVKEFIKRFFDTKIFYDRFAKRKFGKYLIRRHKNGPVELKNEAVHQLIEESQLFIDAAHTCFARLNELAIESNLDQ